jgi:hypothetical protein
MKQVLTKCIHSNNIINESLYYVGTPLGVLYNHG